MMLVTGDWHGEHRVNKMCLPNIDKLTKDDFLFVCGDWGYVFFGNKLEESHLNNIEKKYPFTLCVVDGNHENFELLYQYPEEEWNGGRVHRIRKNIVHLMRGQIFTINGKKIFSFGGGYSYDKEMRQEKVSWWPQEMPSEEEYEIGRQNLMEAGFKVDYILSHTAPSDTVAIFHEPHSKEVRLNFFLEWVREETEYKHWYFGHFHRDEDLWRHQTVLHFDVRDMETNASIFDEEGAKRYF